MLIIMAVIAGIGGFLFLKTDEEKIGALVVGVLVFLIAAIGWKILLWALPLLFGLIYLYERSKNK